MPPLSKSTKKKVTSSSSSFSSVKRRKAAPAKKAIAIDTNEEDDCGFKFRRLNEPSPRTKKKTTTTTATIPDTKQESIISRRRRSSFALIAARRTSFPANETMKNGSGRNSSIAFSVSLTMKLPSSDIHPAFYHRHLLPDLPGPVKMRQLLIWAVQKVAHQRGSELTIRKGKNLLLATEDISKALYSNKINCSWYQRSSQTDSSSSSCTTSLKNGVPKGPKNQEIADCIDLYERYCAKLQSELLEWQTKTMLDPSPLLIPSPAIEDSFLVTGVSSGSGSKDLYSASIDLQKWWSTQWPLGVDKFCWAVGGVSNFQDHSSLYCEYVFRQLRQRIWGEKVSSDIRKGITGSDLMSASLSFASRKTTPSTTPMMLLRALSSAKASLN